jgi:hypothetical protein
MDAGYRTPLLDCFRRGEVAPDIRLLAAQGVLAPRALEQLGLLVFLSDDADLVIRAAAAATIGGIPVAVLGRFLGRPDVPEEIRTFFEQRGVAVAPPSADVPDGPLVEVGRSDVEPEPGEADPEGDGVAPPDEPRLATVQRLSRLNVTEKIKAAMRGTREERSVLIRDSNKLVSVAVLSSPKVSEQEVESYAKMASLSEDVLRIIGGSRAWAKNYSIMKSLAFNPKTPVAVSMGFVNRLVEKDVRSLSTDRNVPEPVKILARKIVQAGQSRKH